MVLGPDGADPELVDGPMGDIEPALVAGLDVPTTADALAARYGADVDIVRHDLEALLDALAERRLVEDRP